MSFNLDNITRENVKGLNPYSSARDEYVSDGSTMVFLDANENPFENGVNSGLFVSLIRTILSHYHPRMECTKYFLELI